jgi:hypothetical protein
MLNGKKRIQIGIRTGRQDVRVSQESLGGRVRLVPVDGMKSWTVLPNNREALFVNTETTLSNLTYGF